MLRIVLGVFDVLWGLHNGSPLDFKVHIADTFILNHLSFEVDLNLGLVKVVSLYEDKKILTVVGDSLVPVVHSNHEDEF